MATHSRRFSTSTRDALVARPDMDLPAYTRRTNSGPTPRHDRVEHTFTLVDSSKDKAWATLTLQSSAKSHKCVPTYFQREEITGSVDLSLVRGDAVVAISVMVRGRIITGSNACDIFTFLEQSQTLWSKSDPNNAPRFYSGFSTTYENTTDAKLYGDYTWPISIALPKKICAPNGSGSGTQLYPLPASFVERYTRASVQYDLTVTIQRTKIRSNDQLSTSFVYIPLIRSEAPSMLRQLATQEGFMTPGPAADPEGWTNAGIAITRGAQFSSRPVSAKCKLLVAKPLSYTRGCSIPVILEFECQDNQTLGFFLNTQTASVQLRRRVRYYLQTAWGANKSVGWQEETEDICAASWWPTPTAGSKPYEHTGRLSGEIRIPKDVKPSTEIAHFTVNYSIILAGSDASKSAGNGPLIEVPIQIGTHHAKGLRPNTSSPPDYSQ